MKKRAEAHYAGRVQGVGFRYTAENLATQYGVTGYVKNLGNGQVELVVEGEELTLKNMLADLRGQMDRYVENEQLDWFDPTGEFIGFMIRY